MSTVAAAIEQITPLGHDLLGAFATLPELPRKRYLDPQLFDLELEHVFRHKWLPVANACELVGAGTYLTRDLPFAPVVLVRGGEGSIRAFLNSCAHRGARVAQGAGGCVRRLTCRYHAWTYDLEGKLIGVPSQEDFGGGFDRSKLGLRELRCEQWGQMIFINLDPDAAPLAEWMAPFSQDHEAFYATPVRLVDRRSRIVECNWKAAVDAFYEGYHLPSTHRQTAAQAFDPRETRLELLKEGHGTMFLRYHRLAAQRQGWRNELLAIPGYAYGDFAATLHPFPNALTSIQPFGYHFMMFWPISVEQTRLDVSWYGLDWGTEELPAAWQARLDNWEMLLDEDVENLGPIQRSMAADPERGIPIGTQECRLLQFHAFIDRAIGLDRIPSELRAPDIL